MSVAPLIVETPLDRAVRIINDLITADRFIATDMLMQKYPGDPSLLEHPEIALTGQGYLTMLSLVNAIVSESAPGDVVRHIKLVVADTPERTIIRAIRVEVPYE